MTLTKAGLRCTHKSRLALLQAFSPPCIPRLWGGGGRFARDLARYRLICVYAVAKAGRGCEDNKVTCQYYEITVFLSVSYPNLLTHRKQLKSQVPVTRRVGDLCLNALNKT